MTGHTTTVESNHRGRHWAHCLEKGCGWLGPMRDTWDEAQADQDAHIVATEGAV